MKSSLYTAEDEMSELYNIANKLCQLIKNRDFDDEEAAQKLMDVARLAFASNELANKL